MMHKWRLDCGLWCNNFDVIIFKPIRVQRGVPDPEEYPDLILNERQQIVKGEDYVL